MSKPASCCSCITKHVHPPAPDKLLLEGFDAQGRWDAISMFSCFGYKNKQLAGCGCCPGEYLKACTWCPLLMPQAVHSSCIPFGKAVTIMNMEEEKGEMCIPQCQLGRRGCAACLCLWVPIQLGGLPPAAPAQFSFVAAALTTAQRIALKAEYGLKEEDGEGLCKVFFCYPCALWKHVIFLQEANLHMLAKKKQKEDTTLLQDISAGVENIFGTEESPGKAVKEADKPAAMVTEEQVKPACQCSCV